MRTIQIVGGILVFVVWILSVQARRHPRVGWLRPFADAFPARRRRGTTPVRPLATITSTRLPGFPPAVLPPNAFERTADRLLEQQARRRTIITGAQLILLGIIIPPAYAVLEMMMFFSETTTPELWIVGSLSALCIVSGVLAIWTNRHR